MAMDNNYPYSFNLNVNASEFQPSGALLERMKNNTPTRPSATDSSITATGSDKRVKIRNDDNDDTIETAVKDVLKILKRDYGNQQNQSLSGGDFATEMEKLTNLCPEFHMHCTTGTLFRLVQQDQSVANFAAQITSHLAFQVKWPTNESYYSHFQRQVKFKFAELKNEMMQYKDSRNPVTLETSLLGFTSFLAHVYCLLKAPLTSMRYTPLRHVLLQLLLALINPKPNEDSTASHADLFEARLTSVAEILGKTGATIDEDAISSEDAVSLGFLKDLYERLHSIKITNSAVDGLVKEILRRRTGNWAAV